jgi:hypothetical protein
MQKRLPRSRARQTGHRRAAHRRIEGAEPFEGIDVLAGARPANGSSPERGIQRFGDKKTCATKLRTKSYLKNASGFSSLRRFRAARWQ